MIAEGFECGKFECDGLSGVGSNQRVTKGREILAAFDGKFRSIKAEAELLLDENSEIQYR